MTTMICPSKDELIERYFPKTAPYYGNPRENQPEVIHRIVSAIMEGKKLFVLNAPTGTGKSVILYTVAKAVMDLVKSEGWGSIITTSQKVLQDQYQGDFEDIFVLKGRSNYPCLTPIEDEDPTCDNGICQYTSEKPICSNDCPYKIAKNKAKVTPIVALNLAYFITENNVMRSFGQTTFGERQLVIIDEAHNIENALMSFVECPISDNLLKACQLKDFNPYVPNENYFDDYIPWLRELSDVLIKEYTATSKMIEEQGLPNSQQAKKIKRIERLQGKINFLLANSRYCKWIADFDDERGRVAFKPINVSTLARSLVFSYGDFYILSSATISEMYVTKCLGIPREEFDYMEIPSTFPVENRKIIAMNTGKMNYDTINKTLPKLVIEIDDLLDTWVDKKGIIHATSYKIAAYIKERSRHKDRLISHNSVDRMEKLRLHCETNEPTVLLSPSMTEGVDLKDDLSRFQIICKIPFASLADKQIKARMQEDKIWYANLAAVVLMQAYGRSIRSAEDVAITYVMDSGFKYFLKVNKELFANWFLEAVV